MNQKRDPEKKNGLFIPTRQVTAYTSLALSLLGVVFMAGYFFGKKHMVDQFVAKIEQDSFADQISASLCSLYDQELEPMVVAQLDEEISPESLSTLPEEQIPVALNKQEESVPDEALLGGHYAQLIGYGTQKAADKFAHNLQKKGIPALVKTRKSQTAQGKQSIWYQVVTEPFTDKNALEQLAQRVAKDENIQGIQIVSC